MKQRISFDCRSNKTLPVFHPPAFEPASSPAHLRSTRSLQPEHAHSYGHPRKANDNRPGSENLHNADATKLELEAAYPPGRRRQAREMPGKLTARRKLRLSNSTARQDSRQSKSVPRDHQDKDRCHQYRSSIHSTEVRQDSLCPTGAVTLGQELKRCT